MDNNARMKDLFSSYDTAQMVTDRLCRYARVDTQSSRTSTTVPTTACQFDLARLLESELRDIGVPYVRLDDKECVVYAKLPATAGSDINSVKNTSAGNPMPAAAATMTAPAAETADAASGAVNSISDAAEDSRTLGLIAHMDTAPDAPGEGCKPWVLKNYQGGDIILNRQCQLPPEEGRINVPNSDRGAEQNRIILSPSVFPELRQYIGQDLVLTDGTTLLGGDDKASIAAIMTFLEIVIREKLPHGMISVAFTPDEEVGGLARGVDLKEFEAPAAYTLDGDHLGWYMDETFNADAAEAIFHGFSVHTGTAKGKMRNSLLYAAEFIELLPADERPETTEGMAGFYHVTDASGDVEESHVNMIIRDFDLENFRRREDFLRSAIGKINEKYGAGTAEIRFQHQYRSMKEVVDRYPHLTADLRAAITASGLTPVKQAFRGGTDGSALSHRGLPCPNLSAGYENAHGRFEYVPVQSMVKNVEILLRLL